MNLRYVIRDGEKVLQEWVEVPLFKETIYIKSGWKDVHYGHIPTVDEETGEEIKG